MRDGIGALLLVDDDERVREALVALLEAQGYPVVGAANGREALDVLRVRGLRPGLILLDLMMPVMDGWQFRAAQLADAELAAIPVVVFSAHPRARETAVSLRAARVIAKPLDIDELLEVVRAYCATGDLRPGGSG